VNVWIEIFIYACVICMHIPSRLVFRCWISFKSGIFNLEQTIKKIINAIEYVYNKTRK